MFFFFVGGLEQQAGRILQSGAGRCIRCGSFADLVESEKVLKLFFVPVWRWPSKAPAFCCRNCHLLFPQSLPLNDDADGDGSRLPLDPLARPLTCRTCDRLIEPHFRFCPFCGSSV